MNKVQNIFNICRAALRIWLFTVSLVFICPAAFAQTGDIPTEPSVIILPAGDNFAVDVGLHAVFLAEKDNILTLKQAVVSDKWVPVNLALIDGARASPDGSSSAPYALGNPTWVYFKINNNGDLPRKIVLDTGRPDLRNIAIYEVNTAGKTSLVVDHNDQHAFGRRSVSQNDLAVNLQIKPGEQRRIYMRFVRTVAEPMALKIFGTDAYTKRTRLKAVWAAVVLSCLGTIVLITFLGLPALGWRIAVSYIFYVSIVGFWYASVTGHFFSLAMPNLPVVASRAVEAFAVLVFAAFLNMGRVLFRFKEISPLYDKVLVFVIAANLLCAGFNMLVDIYTNRALANAVSILTLVSSVLYVCNGILAVRAKRNGAVAALIGSLSLFAAFAVYRYITVAVNAGELVLPIGRALLIPPISLVEVSLFALAIIQVQIGIRRQRDQAQRSEFEAVEEQLRLSGALREADKSYQKAHLQAKLRKERLSSVSHDILQPLTSLRTTLGEAKHMDATKAQHMQDAFDYLETLARDSLGVPTDEDGAALETHSETFKVSAVTDNVFTMFKDEAKAKGLAFHYQADELEITSSPVELMRVINNLVSNAIKHTDKGQVTLTCLARDAQDGGANIVVEDTGAGMTKTEIETYLKPYQKGEMSAGTGLGLHQVKTACAALGHTFELSSNPGKGTKATVLI